MLKVSLVVWNQVWVQFMN